MDVLTEHFLHASLLLCLASQCLRSSLRREPAYTCTLQLRITGRALNLSLCCAGPQDKVTQQYIELVPALSALAKNLVRDVDPQNDLEFVRIRSNKHEIMVAPSEWHTAVVVFFFHAFMSSSGSTAVADY